MADTPRDGLIDLAKIRELAALMKEQELSELALRQGETEVRLKREGAVVESRYVPAVSAPASAPVTPVAASQPAADSGSFAYIKSPMVGTFYSRPNPKAEAYVKIGDFVDPETTICIIEAMKVFNEIPAEVRGRVVAVLANDEEPVEFGKPLFKIDTSG